MINIKVGDILKRKDNDNKCKVLGIVGEVVFISADDDFKKSSPYYWTLDELKERFDLPKQEWVPQEGDTFWYLTDVGDVLTYKWINHPYDYARKNFFGIFPTKEEAEARVKEVREFIKGLK